jgi:hypothetical protein
MKPNSQSNTILNDEIEKKKSIKKNWVNWINIPNLQPRSWDEDNPIKSKSSIEEHETEITS